MRKNLKTQKTIRLLWVYIFNTDKLIEYLEADDADLNSSNDFGKNVIPNLLSNGERLYAYRFEGYWRDVGTIKSLWNANMDLLGKDPLLCLSDRSFKIYSRNKARPPQFIGKEAKISNSLVSEGCKIEGEIVNSVISSGVVVERGAKIYGSVIMEDVLIKSGAKVYNSIIDSGTVVESGINIGYLDASNDKICVVEKDSVVLSNI